MFNVGPGEIIVIALVLLIAVGPEQLPSLIRRIGSAVAQVRGMTDSLRSEFMAGLDEIDRAVDPNAWAASAGPSDNAPKPKPKPRTAVTPPTGPAERAEDVEAEPTDGADAESA
ncbi:MAG: twin-arginine translocase TatA/TatE family subunit, partial [Acidimicrobiales bacterium]